MLRSWHVFHIWTEVRRGIRKEIINDGKQNHGKYQQSQSAENVLFVFACMDEFWNQNGRVEPIHSNQIHIVEQHLDDLIVAHLGSCKKWIRRGQQDPYDRQVNNRFENLLIFHF